MKKRLNIKFTVWQLLALGYLGVILAGSGLLSMPSATANGTTSYINALLTATSATCVTGLIAYDTGTHWSLFGQLIILLLIQTGGLGFMTFVSVTVKMLGKKMGLFGNTALMLASGGSSFAELRTTVTRIVKGSAIVEGSGALLLSIRFIRDFGFAKGVYFAVFHSVSAFCNAGFDLLGSQYGEYCSLSHYATDPIVSVTVCLLIILGGLGFCVWSDVLDTKFNWKKFRLHTKIVLSGNAVLLLSSTILFWLFERNTEQMRQYSAASQVLIAFFNAATTRTAGFASIDFGKMSGSGYLLSVVLMFIGGSSGSTAGGIKVNTVAVIFMGMFAAFSGRSDVNAGKKRISQAMVSQALAILVSCLFLVIASTLTICAIEPDAPFLSVLFETVSALGTVGLTISLTPTLSPASKIIIILLMYAGRVGILTIGLAFAEKRSMANIRKPVDDTVLIG